MFVKEENLNHTLTATVIKRTHHSTHTSRGVIYDSLSWDAHRKKKERDLQHTTRKSDSSFVFYCEVFMHTYSLNIYLLHFKVFLSVTFYILYLEIRNKQL